jgi:eukaryotic-like serine/threonine-protein kinase
MSESDHCPRCGAALPPGLTPEACPRCLLKLGLDSAAYTDSSISDCPERIGPYRILSVLGEGGMGTVYLAEQEVPLRRKVALKIIKRGMDTREVIARFESERQALALMSHPGIARVFDAGTTPDGLPYFVMEHVSGVPITEYCDQNQLSADERLRLFIEVCGAVQHAHQKGIIHRDIKPTNVLVTVEDDGPRTKVIDFGVAKAIRQRLTEKTLFTQQGVLVGTPGYVSPEQAGVTELDVDTRTDVYSLGVLLYELLVGRAPFDPRRLRQAGWTEMQRIIREEEPVKPSTRVSGLGESATAVAERRRTDPMSLRRELAGDLDWITLKALDKDRARRYASVSELAADIERHLGHEPVTASPPSASYRLRKLVRRHRAAFAAAAAVFLALAAGLVGTIWQAGRATRQAARADEEARQAKSQRDFALRELSRAEAINDLNAFVLSDAAPSGKPFTAGELLARAERIVDRQPDETGENKVELLIAIGRQYQNQEQDDRARQVLEKAYALSGALSEPATRAKAACALAGAIALAGEHDRAEALLAEAQAALPDEPRFALHRVFCFLRGSEVAREHEDGTAGIERVLAARKVLEESSLTSPLLQLRVTMALAEAYRMASRNRDACDAFARASIQLEALGRDETELAGTLWNNWGVALNTLGQPLEAEKRFRKAIQLSSADGTDQNVSPMLLNNLARALRDLNRLSEAADYAERAYAKGRQTGEEIVVNQSLIMRGSIYRQMGDLDRAAAMFSELDPRIRRMFKPGHTFFATLASQRSLLYQARGDLQAAIAAADFSIAVAEASPTGSDYLPSFLLRRSGIELAMGRLEAAAADAERALRMEQKAAEPGTFSAAIGRAFLALGRALGVRGERNRARTALTSAEEHLRPSLGSDHPETREARRLAALGP